MPRPLRYTIPGVPQHIVQRGNDRRATFFSDDDRRFYLACLYEASRRHDLAVHAFVLMTNHVHLLATPSSADSISRTLQSIGRRYVQFVNVSRQRTGTLWEGRHRASIVQSERYLAVCHAYIELNPVRAGMVANPLDYEWSSCRHYAGSIHDPVISDAPSFVRSACNLDERRRVHWARLEAGLSEGSVSAIRLQTARGGVIGDDEYRAQIATLLARPLPGRPRGRPRNEDVDPHANSQGPQGPDLFKSGN